MVTSAGNLTEGDIVSGLDPAELVEIQRIAPFGNKTLVVVHASTLRRSLLRASRRPIVFVAILVL